MTQQVNTLIIGASISGLASAAALQKQSIEYIIIEKQSQIAAPWHNHYQRLHLHTNKRLSNLPYKKFDNKIPRYASKQEVLNYLEDYKKAFNINPIFNTEAISIYKAGNEWISETNNGSYKSKYIIIATGVYGNPKPFSFKGMERFKGKIMHSRDYKTGKDFKEQKVLVIGFGNSACEIAIDLYEQGAMPHMSVRSAVNIIPSDLFGIPVLEIILLLNKLPPRLADTLCAPLLKFVFGDITKLGLKKKHYGPYEQIQKDGTIPLIDIGTIKHIKQGHIKVLNEVDYLEEKTVFFKDGRKEMFDVIIAAIGYNKNLTEIINIDESRFEDLKSPVDKQNFFGKDELYFCGFRVSSTGLIHEITSDAKEIAKDISNKENAK